MQRIEAHDKGRRKKDPTFSRLWSAELELKSLELRPKWVFVKVPPSVCQEGMFQGVLGWGEALAGFQ